LRMTRGLAEKNGKKLVACRGEKPFTSVLELSRRAGIASGALVRLAKADTFHSLGLSRRDASWAIKALKDDELPLFAEADRRASVIRYEQTELPVVLPAMPKGREVVEDYRSHGLSLRPHPLAFLRDRLIWASPLAPA
jgi:error-prone DNA polymerase